VDPTWVFQINKWEIPRLVTSPSVLDALFVRNLVRIGETVRNDQLKSTPELQKLAERVKAAGSTLHLLGLCSDGGVHSHVNHLCGVIRWAAEAGITKVAVHVITDGRDTPTQSAPGYVKAVQDSLQSTGIGSIASLCGRYWAMDRDQRWERTDKAYRLYTDPDIDVDQRQPETILSDSYGEGITDEFLEPARLQDTVMQDGDALLMFNFRPDRARQIIQALCLDDFEGFEREHTPTLDVLTFTQLEQNLPVSVAFPPEPLNNLLGQVVAEAGLLQYRTAETEKYPHVTYFMNGGIEQPLPGEERHLVPSPRVATYDLSPAMSADELTASCIKAIETRKVRLNRDQLRQSRHGGAYGDDGRGQRGNPNRRRLHWSFTQCDRSRGRNHVDHS
jgi:2,3-bisphosphoglycerate-independent phosphoglycerate mutase